MVFNPLDRVWTEKYRPQHVNEIVGDFKFKILEHLKNPMATPHFLFHSRIPGTGKTSLAKAICNDLNCDVLIINSSDDRKIETMREKVKEFCMTQTSKTGIKRCIILDEADGLTKVSQEALRNMMETYSSNAFFILTANNLNRIVEPIKNRCVVIPFAYPSKEEIYKYLENICVKETIDYTEEGLKLLIDENYPSIRNCVISLQDLKVEGKKAVKENITRVNQAFDDMWKLIKEKKWLEIKKIIMEGTIEPRDLNTYFWQKALEEENIKILQITCRNEKDISIGADSKVILITSLVECIK